MPTEVQLPADAPPLKTYYVYVSGACNLACRHCWITPSFVRSGAGKDEKNLPFEVFEQAVREAEPLGLEHVKFTGGEPMLNPELRRMLDYAAVRQLAVTMETNGTLVTAEWARYLREKTTLGFLSVSMDGAGPATHDYVRNVPGSFAQAQTGIRHLVEAGFHPQVIMSIYEGNIAEIEPLAAWAASAGCSSLKLNIIQESGRAERFGERIKEIAPLVALGRWVETELQDRVSIPLHYSWPPAFHRLRYLDAFGGCDSCGILGILGLLHSGHLAMCGIGIEENNLVYGLIGQDAVADVWIGHPLLKQMREALPSQLKGICHECLLRDVCLGQCVANTYHLTQDLLAPYWFCELADQAGLFPASRKRRFSTASASPIA
jgi:SynChlorMet cassette radical SAM/SPASM protein ScmF